MIFRPHLSVLLPCEWWGRRFLKYFNTEAVPNKRQPEDSLRKKLTSRLLMLTVVLKSFAHPIKLNWSMSNAEADSFH